jgi:hypothetical protein
MRQAERRPSLHGGTDKGQGRRYLPPAPQPQPKPAPRQPHAPPPACSLHGAIPLGAAILRPRPRLNHYLVWLSLFRRPSFTPLVTPFVTPLVAALAPCITGFTPLLAPLMPSFTPLVTPLMPSFTPLVTPLMPSFTPLLAPLHALGLSLGVRRVEDYRSCEPQCGPQS